MSLHRCAMPRSATRRRSRLLSRAREHQPSVPSLRNIFILLFCPLSCDTFSLRMQRRDIYRIVFFSVHKSLTRFLTKRAIVAIQNNRLDPREISRLRFAGRRMYRRISCLRATMDAVKKIQRRGNRGGARCDQSGKSRGKMCADLRHRELRREWTFD